MVVPTSYGFDDDQVYVHGSVASGSLAVTGLPAVPVPARLRARPR